MAADRARIDRRSRTLAGVLTLKSQRGTKAQPWNGDAYLLGRNNPSGVARRALKRARHPRRRRRAACLAAGAMARQREYQWRSRRLVLKLTQAKLGPADRLHQAANFDCEPGERAVMPRCHPGQHRDLVFDRSKPVRHAAQLPGDKFKRDVSHGPNIAIVACVVIPRLPPRLDNPSPPATGPMPRGAFKSTYSSFDNPGPGTQQAAMRLPSLGGQAAQVT
jgi:hypothetical protein